MARTRKLDPHEIRVLGSLMEKEQTTPEAYPMTINTVIAACNQKTSRDPVTRLTETEVVEALDRLRRDALTWRSEGARSERWEHLLDRRWQLDRKRKPLITLLLLRGAQTPGELKTRSERMHRYASREEVEETLSQMADGFDALVRELPRRPGQRENRWIHLMAVQATAAAEATETAAEAESPENEERASAPRPRRTTAESVAEPASPAPDAAAEPAPERIEQLERNLAELQQTVKKLTDELHDLRRRLGD